MTLPTVPLQQSCRGGNTHLAATPTYDRGGHQHTALAYGNSLTNFFIGRKKRSLNSSALLRVVPHLASPKGEEQYTDPYLKKNL